jgi:hypothetical protein
VGEVTDGRVVGACVGGGEVTTVVGPPERGTVFTTGAG